MNKYLILFLVAGMCLFSCSSDEEMMEEEVISPYEGIWNGTVSGNLVAEYVMNVSPKGNVSAEVSVPSRGPIALRLVGTVTDDGEVEASGQQGGDRVEYTGTLRESSGSGTWSLENTTTSENLSGSWKVEKV